MNLQNLRNLLDSLPRKISKVQDPSDLREIQQDLRSLATSPYAAQAESHAKGIFHAMVRMVRETLAEVCPLSPSAEYALIRDRKWNLAFLAAQLRKLEPFREISPKENLDLDLDLEETEPHILRRQTVMYSFPERLRKAESVDDLKGIWLDLKEMEYCLLGLPGTEISGYQKIVSEMTQKISNLKRNLVKESSIRDQVRLLDLEIPEILKKYQNLMNPRFRQEFLGEVLLESQ